MLPSLPVRDFVLRGLGIADNELPDGLARLKNNLLFSPSDRRFQESNLCPNATLGSFINKRVRVTTGFPEGLEDTIAKEKFHGQDFINAGCHHKDYERILIALSYLDQIAIVCIAAGLYACRAPSCLQYRGVLNQTVPQCRSWPGLRDWVLVFISCLLCSMGDKAVSRANEQPVPGGVEVGMVIQERLQVLKRLSIYDSSSAARVRLFIPFKLHMTACIAFTASHACLRDRVLEIEGHKEDIKKHEGVGFYSSRVLEAQVSLRRCPRFTPEFLTCLRKGMLARIGPAFIPKHLILYKREPVHRLMLQRSSS